MTGPLWATNINYICEGVPFVPTPMTCFKDCRKSNIRTNPFEVPIAMTPDAWISIESVDVQLELLGSRIYVFQFH